MVDNRDLSDSSDRASAVVQAAHPEANHELGVDGDDASVADRAAEAGSKPDIPVAEPADSEAGDPQVSRTTEPPGTRKQVSESAS